MMITKSTFLEYTNSAGLSVGLSPFQDYFLTECNEDLKNDIVSNKIQYLDGKAHISMTLDSRLIELVGYLNVYSNYDGMARHLQKAFNLKLSGKLTYQNHSRNTKYEIDCKVLELPKIELINGQTIFTINLEAQNPYWRGEGRKENIAMVRKLGKFPLVIPKSKFIFGTITTTLKSTFENVGDAPASVRFILSAESGTVTNPEITLEGDTPQTLKIVRKFEKGEYAELIHTPDKVSCIINGKENGMKYLSEDDKREWFYLQVGENTVSYNAQENVTNLKVMAEYTPLYLGVY